LKAETPADNTGKQLTASLLARAAIVLPLLAAYLTSFWGNFTSVSPGSTQGYFDWIVRWFAQEHCGSVMRDALSFYTRHVTIPPGEYLLHRQIVWLAVGVVMAGIIPLLLAALTGRWPGCMGLRLPNRWGWRMVALCVGVTIPFAFFFADERMGMTGRHQPSAAMQLLIMIGVSIPEHIFLTGVCLASFCTGWRLPGPAKLAPVEGSGPNRALRWLGLAQPADPALPPHQRDLAWWGLDGPSLLAITCAGLLFGLIHVGAGRIEFTSSFFGGFALGYLVWRSGSIWPGWAIHVFQMLMVTLFILVGGR